MKQKVLVSAIRKIVGAELLLTAAFMPVAFAQTAPATPASGTTATTPADSSATKLDRVEVTGSLIKQSDKTGYNQVQTVTAKDIQDSGYTNVADYLRSISANSGSSWDQGTNDSFAPGASGIALRGLSEKYTLVLVDGQRVTPYAFAVNGTDTFFDLNTLPLNIIERIEVVKTGAVSQYGSDAIAGVVNIITKRNMHGLTLDGSYGGATSGGAGTTKFSAAGGFGDLNSDRYNISGAVSYYKENGVLLSDRDNTQNLNYLNKPGGLLEQGQSFLNNGGDNVALAPCPNGGHAVNGALTGGSGTECVNNTAANQSLQPQTTRWSAKVDGTFKINDNVQAYAGLWFSRNETTQNISAAGFNSGSTYFDPATGGIAGLANGGLLSANNPANPFGNPVFIQYTFPQTESVDTVSNFVRATTGVKGSFSTGSFGDWDWKAEYGHSQNVVSNTYTNVISAPVLNSILNDGTFNFASPTGMPAGLLTDASTQGISKLDTVDLTASTPNLFKLPTGDVGFGIGAQFLHESEVINGVTEDVVPAGVQEVDGQRNVWAAYYEFNIPIIGQILSFDQSGRYDHYSDFGGAFSPHFALRFQPIQAFTAYASFARGFRAPTLIEGSQSKTFSAQSASDPFSPVSTAAALVTEITNGNPNLQPERTRNYNLGFQLSPTKTTDIGFDWYRIEINNAIAQTGDSIQTQINNQEPTVVRNASGTIEYVNTSYGNVSYLDTDGFEFTFSQRLPTSIGTFTLSGDWAYVWHFKMPNNGIASDFAGNNGAFYEPFGASIPRWKGTTDLSWNYNKWAATLSWEYTGPYTNAIANVTGGYPGASGSVGSWSIFNLYATYSGIKNWTIYGGINNIFNRAPNFDPVWQATPDASYDSSLYNYIGRFVQVGATYHFK
ncbi:TonB-dependent receptor [Pararobbsia alpina]|uniref:TonB-dependent receptor n=1 Tax=Pararobbsia alpina TaxID=621374 RepID=UPI0039A450F0